MEAKAVGSLHRDHIVLTGREASRKNILRSTSNSPVDVLHCACHGHTDEELGDTLLALAEGSFLGVRDVLEQTLLARGGLCVMSACEAGFMSNYYPLANVFPSLVDSWLVAGANHVVSPLWSIRSLHSTLMSVLIHKYIAEQNQPSEAVRAAGNDLRSGFSLELREHLRGVGQLPQYIELMRGVQDERARPDIQDVLGWGRSMSQV